MICELNGSTTDNLTDYWWRPEGTTTPPANNFPANHSVCDGSWDAKDLGAETFFKFLDVKPGDEGENTISLHVLNNDAWACVDVNITKNDDMTCTEPELVGDTSCLSTTADTNFTDGELAQNIYFTAWADDGDNIWEANEPLLFTNQSGPASDVLGGKTYAIADSITGTPLTGDVTKNIGLAWCAGTQTVTESTHTIACNGASMGNNTQTDSMEASIAFRVEQSRNNLNFKCSNQQISTVSVHNLQPNWDNSVYSAYYWPNSSSAGVSPGSTAVYDGRGAGIIKAGITPIAAGGNYEDEGILAFQVPSVAVATFAGQALTYDVENQTGTNPVWVRIRLVGGNQYQFVPASYGVLGGYHTINAAAGQWYLMDINGNAIGSPMTLSQVAAANPAAQVDRVYLTLGIGNSYNVSAGVGTVGWVDKITIGGVTYDFQ